VKWVKPLHDPHYDPLWKVCEDLEIPVQCHGGTGNPDYGSTPVSGLLYITETSFYSQRPLVHMILGGVFERFPKLKLVLTEMGCAWIPGVLAQLDGVINSIRATRSIGELRYTDDQVLNHTATEYVQRNVWVGASQPRPPDAAAREVLGEHRFMWGSDYPHDEGTHPFTKEHLRQVFSGTPSDELQRILGGNAAELFDFDLDALRAEADRVGPTVAEIAQPLTEIPDDANQALRRGAGATL
jgi:predicted TIM-barrel fold metal-dependent hydrolase